MSFSPWPYVMCFSSQHVSPWETVVAIPPVALGSLIISRTPAQMRSMCIWYLSLQSTSTRAKTLASILSTRSIVISVLLCCCLLETLLKSDWFIWCRSGTSSHATANKEELCRQMILYRDMYFWVVFWNSTQIWSILVLYSSLDRGPFGYLLRRHHNRLPDLRHQRARQQDPAHTRVPAPAAVDRHQRGKYSCTGWSISAGHEHFSKLAIAHLG